MPSDTPCTNLLINDITSPNNVLKPSEAKLATVSGFILNENTGHVLVEENAKTKFEFLNTEKDCYRKHMRQGCYESCLAT